LGELVVFQKPEEGAASVGLIDEIRSIEVVDRSSCAMMAEALRRIAAVKKKITDWYTPRKADARRVWQQLVDDEKMFLDPLVEAEKVGKQSIAAFELEEKRKANEMAARIALETGSSAVIVLPKTEGVSTTTLWRWRLTDVDLLPREYMVPDEKLINRIVRERKDSTHIPGLEVYSELSVSATRKGRQ